MTIGWPVGATVVAGAGEEPSVGVDGVNIMPREDVEVAGGVGAESTFKGTAVPVLSTPAARARPGRTIRACLGCAISLMTRCAGARAVGPWFSVSSLSGSSIVYHGGRSSGWPSICQKGNTHASKTT